MTLLIERLRFIPQLEIELTRNLMLNFVSWRHCLRLRHSLRLHEEFSSKNKERKKFSVARLEFSFAPVTTQLFGFLIPTLFYHWLFSFMFYTLSLPQKRRHLLELKLIYFEEFFEKTLQLFNKKRSAEGKYFDIVWQTNRNSIKSSVETTLCHINWMSWFKVLCLFQFFFCFAKRNCQRLRN